MADPNDTKARSTKGFKGGFCLGCVLGVIAWGLLTVGALALLFRPISEAFIPEHTPEELGGEPLVASDTEGAAVLRELNAKIGITIDEEHFNRFIKAKGEQMGVPSEVARLHFKLGDGEMEARMEALTFIRAVQMRIRLRPELHDGDLILHVEELRAGGLRMPGFIRGFAEDAVRSTLRDATSGAGFDVENIEVAEGEVTISGLLRSVEGQQDARDIL